MKGLKNIKIFVTAHPKTDGSLEQRMITKENAKNVFLVAKGTYSTFQLGTIASLLACHKSSVALQMLYKGIPVLYVAGKDDDNNTLIKNQLAVRVETSQTIAKLVPQIIADAHKRKPSLDKLGLPQHASKNIARFLEVLLK